MPLVAYQTQGHHGRDLFRTPFLQTAGNTHLPEPFALLHCPFPPLFLGPKGVCSLLKALRALQAAPSHGVLAWQAGDEAKEVALGPTVETEGSYPCEERMRGTAGLVPGHWYPSVSRELLCPGPSAVMMLHQQKPAITDKLPKQMGFH